MVIHLTGFEETELAELSILIWENIIKWKYNHQIEIINQQNKIELLISISKTPTSQVIGMRTDKIAYQQLHLRTLLRKFKKEEWNL